MKGGLRVEEFYGIGLYLEDEMWELDNWVKYFLEVFIKDELGLNFFYNFCELMFVGVVLLKVIGKSIMDFSKEYFFELLGILDYCWIILFGGYGMIVGFFFMKLWDMFKLGEMVLCEGNW